MSWVCLCFFFTIISTSYLLRFGSFNCWWGATLLLLDKCLQSILLSSFFFFVCVSLTLDNRDGGSLAPLPSSVPCVRDCLFFPSLSKSRSTSYPIVIRTWDCTDGEHDNICEKKWNWGEQTASVKIRGKTEIEEMQQDLRKQNAAPTISCPRAKRKHLERKSTDRTKKHIIGSLATRTPLVTAWKENKMRQWQ